MTFGSSFVSAGTERRALPNWSGPGHPAPDRCQAPLLGRGCRAERRELGGHTQMIARTSGPTSAACGTTFAILSWVKNDDD